MKVTRIIYISDYPSEPKMERYDWVKDDKPLEVTDPWIKNTLGSCDLIVLAEFDTDIIQEFTIIWDKYNGWQNGFEHFNNDEEEVEIDE